MCGIAGIINYGKPSTELQTRVLRMRDALAHRGPDGTGLHLSPHAAIAHVRLALIDVSGGTQPQVSADQRYIITYNGEIYNFRQLRSELQHRWQFQTDCDTEVVMAAYAAWGEACLARLNGMFAFFIWDTVEHCGFGARDRLGVKPFSYRQANGEFIFASEAKAIVGVMSESPRANTEAILEYLAAPYFSGVESPMFAGLSYLQPGHCLALSADTLSIRKWGDYDLTDIHPNEGPSEADLRETIEAAVSRSLISDVSVGAYLSGGFDSTLLTALAAKEMSDTLTAYTIRFAEQEHYDYKQSLIVSSDDTPFAISAASEIGINHTIVDADRNELPTAMRRLAVVNDALPAWEQEFAQQALARAASRDYKAVLVGDAADETHYGYQFLLDEHATSSPRGLLERFGMAPLNKRHISDPCGFFTNKYEALTNAAGHSWKTPLDRTLATTHLIVKRWLPRLLHNGDMHAMAHSLETRVPFADVELLDLARRVPPQRGYHQGTEKWFLRQAVPGLMPEAIRLRKKSALPKDQGVAKIYKQLAAEALSSGADFLHHYLNIDAIRELCDPARRLSESERATLFRITSLVYWQQAYEVCPE